MMDGLYSALQQYPTHRQQQTTPQKTLHMVKNDRMAGSVPAWKTTSTNSVETSLSRAAAAAEIKTLPQNALSYKAPAFPAKKAQTEAFGFGDLVDMVNPLHHIPIVGNFYRELTGDEIKPIGKIMGGAIFGGPLGAAAGLVNLVAEQETGKDITENAIAFVTSGNAPHWRSHDTILNQTPETRLAAAHTKTQENMPGNLLAFVDMKAQPEIVIQRSAPRQPITQMRFNS
jgi:hypothetical protein